MPSPPSRPHPEAAPAPTSSSARHIGVSTGHLFDLRADLDAAACAVWGNAGVTPKTVGGFLVGGRRQAWDCFMIRVPSAPPTLPRPERSPVDPDGGPIVSALELSKAFGRQNASVTALDRVSVGFEAGRFTSIMGPSGSGKSTLLHCLAGLERPTSGSVVLDGTDLARLSDGQLTTLRRDRLGFVFQAFNLIPTLTAEENITLSERICGARVDRQWLAQLVEVLDLGDRLGHRPSELSGGQQQRVAIARALAHRPTVVFADEPTGNLDSHTGADVLGFLRLAVEQFGQTVVMVTHDPAAAAHCHHVVFLRDGRVEGELSNPTPAGILARLAPKGAPA